MIPSPPSPVAASREAVHQIVEREKIHRLIERLKTSDRAAAAAELLQRGEETVPHLLEALERRDVDLRLAAFEVLRRLVGDGADFDPHAPEAHRRRQLAVLRERCARKAG